MKLHKGTLVDVAEDSTAFYITWLPFTGYRNEIPAARSSASNGVRCPLLLSSPTDRVPAISILAGWAAAAEGCSTTIHLNGKYQYNISPSNNSNILRGKSGSRRDENFLLAILFISSPVQLPSTLEIIILVGQI